MAKHNIIGEMGEQAVGNHLKRKGYTILEYNYRKKWGEIDVIAKIDDVVHFVEVKTVSREIDFGSVTRETYRPEENVHPGKLRKLHRAIETWLREYEYEGEWQIDVASVVLDEKNKAGRIKIIENIVGK